MRSSCSWLRKWVSGMPPMLGEAHQGHHLVAVAAQDRRVDVLRIEAGLHGDERLHAAAVQHARLADHPLAREAAELVRQVGHRVERVGHHDDDAVGRVLDDLFDHAGHDAGVDAHQVFTRHARLAGNAGGDDDDIGVGGVGHIGGTDGVDCVARDGAGLDQVEHLALGQSVHHIHQDDLTAARDHRPMGDRRADKPGADNADFAHEVTP